MPDENFTEVMEDILLKLSRRGAARRFVKNFATRVIPAIESELGQSILPKTSETVAVTFGKEKTAALFFDRLWGYPPPNSIASNEKTPDEVLVYGCTQMELLALVLYIARELDDPTLRKAASDVFAARYKMPFGEYPLAKLISSALREERGLQATAVFNSTKELDREYVAGGNSLLLAVMNNLEIVDDAALDWRQVLEFRKDKRAKSKLRKLRTWLDRDLTGKSIAQVTDAIGSRLEDYEWAVKKHGIKTVSGSISDLLDPRFLGASAAIVGGLWATGSGLAEIAGAGLIVGKVAISIVERLIDFSDSIHGRNSEVAFVHELKKLTK